MDKIKLLILPGDGIGPEAVDEVKKIIDFLNKKKIIKINIEEDLVGGACLDKNHVPIKEGTIKAATVIYTAVVKVDLPR